MSATLRGPEDFVGPQSERLARVMMGSHSASQGAMRSSDSGVNIEREFLEQKRPEGHSQITAVLAFCLTEQGQREFTAKDLWNCYMRADVRPPRSVPQAARDAKSKHGFLESGTARGTFRLSAVGERFVRFDLPQKLER
jgi:hypothetical protein